MVRWMLKGIGMIIWMLKASKGNQLRSEIGQLRNEIAQMNQRIDTVIQMLVNIKKP